MSPLNLIGLDYLMEISEGTPDIVIGLIDGPVFVDHPAFLDSNIKIINESQYAYCKNASSIGLYAWDIYSRYSIIKKRTSITSYMPQMYFIDLSSFYGDLRMKEIMKMAILII